MGLEETQRQVQNLAATFSRRAWLPRRLSLNRMAQYVLLVVFLFLSLLVLLVTLNIALRPRIAVLADFWGLPLPPDWHNFRWAWSYMGQPLLNTLLIIGTAVLGILLFAIPASYALARIRFPGRRVLFYLILAFIMIPPAILLTPNFILAVQ